MKEQLPKEPYISKSPSGFPQENHPVTILLIAILVGIISSFSTVGFIKAYLFLRRLIYLSPTSNLLVIYKSIPLWGAILFFVVGGALIGLFIHYIIPQQGEGHGLINFLHIYRKKKKITLREGLGSTFASNITLALGGSVGREAPIMYFAGSISSWLCSISRVQGRYSQIILLSAVATAIATSLHSTFVAIFFVLEVVAYSLTAVDLIPIALAIFSGTVIREFFPEILPPTFWQFTTQGQIYNVVEFLVLGVFMSVFAIGFIKSLQYTFIWHSQSRLPSWLWPMMGGIVVGLVGFLNPYSLGLSFDIIESVKSFGVPSVKIILFFLLCKFLTTYFSLGFGFSGGILTPLFILGILLGTLYFLILSSMFPTGPYAFQDFAFGGSAIFTASVINAPLTLTILAFEMTHDVTFAINVFMGIVVARLILRFLQIDSCYNIQYRLAHKD